MVLFVRSILCSVGPCASNRSCALPASLAPDRDHGISVDLRFPRPPCLSSRSIACLPSRLRTVTSPFVSVIASISRPHDFAAFPRPARNSSDLTMSSASDDGSEYNPDRNHQHEEGEGSPEQAQSSRAMGKENPLRYLSKSQSNQKVRISSN
jgi:hypothetical protein